MEAAAAAAVPVDLVPAEMAALAALTLVPVEPAVLAVSVVAGPAALPAPAGLPLAAVCSTLALSRSPE